MSGANINVPFVAAMDASGNAQLETVKQETFNFTGAADATFTGVLTPEIISAFTLSQEASGSTVELNVAVANLSGALTTALGAVRDNGVSITQYLTSWAQDQIDADLASNTIGAGVEASSVKNLVLEVDASGAGIAMEDGITGLSAAVRRLIATQLPSSRFPETFSSALPVATGDSMTFRFIASSTVIVNQDAQDLGGAADGATAGAGPGVGSGYGIDSRTIDVVLTKA
jgi:hypothetical protein